MPRPDAVAGPALHPPGRSASTARPKVFGYLRSVEHDAGKLVILHGELVLYAGHRNLDLVEVFTDLPCAGVALERPGFRLLLRALWRCDGAGVLVPARCHLSWRDPVRERLERHVTDTGARLHVVWHDHEQPPALRP